jgi:hypothetical protein
MNSTPANSKARRTARQLAAVMGVYATLVTSRSRRSIGTEKVREMAMLPLQTIFVIAKLRPYRVSILSVLRRSHCIRISPINHQLSREYL